MDDEAKLTIEVSVPWVGHEELEPRIKEMYEIFFNPAEIDFSEFKEYALKVNNDNGNSFIESLEYLSMSEQIQDDNGYDHWLYRHLSMLTMFISIECLMEKESYYTFDIWLTSNKGKVLGKEQRDMLLKDISTETSITEVPSLIKELYEKYNTQYYGASKQVRLFFINYLDEIHKHELITSIQFPYKITDNLSIYAYKCFKSNQQDEFDYSTFVEECENYGYCKYRNNCKLKNEIDVIMGEFANFLYGYYRSPFAHNGKLSAFDSENGSFVYGFYENELIKIRLSYRKFKELILLGIKNYYLDQQNKSSSGK